MGYGFGLLDSSDGKKSRGFGRGNLRVRHSRSSPSKFYQGLLSSNMSSRILAIKHLPIRHSAPRFAQRTPRRLVHRSPPIEAHGGDLRSSLTLCITSEKSSRTCKRHLVGGRRFFNEVQSSRRTENNLQRIGCACVAEGVIGFDELLKCKVMSNEARDIKLTRRDQP